MIRFHVDKHDERVAEEDQVLDCLHTASKGDTFYVVYDYGEPVMWVCKDCVIIDKKEE